VSGRMKKRRLLEVEGSDPAPRVCSQLDPSHLAITWLGAEHIFFDICYVFTFQVLPHLGLVVEKICYLCSIPVAQLPAFLLLSRQTYLVP
jgi:hypothetical protein